MNKDVCCPWRARERGKGWEGTGKVIKKKGRGEGEEEGEGETKKKETNKRGERRRKKERREKKKKFLRWIFKTQQTRYTERVLGGNQGSSLFQMEIHIIPSSYGNVLLFPDFAIFAVPRVRQTKGKRHLNFQTVLYPPINVAMKIDPPSMTNYNHRCIRKRATRMGFTTPYRTRIDDASSIRFCAIFPRTYRFN